MDRLRSDSIGGIIKYIKIGHLTDAEIPLPPLDDQIRIANLLSKVELLSTQRKQNLKQLDELLKSVFLQMFGDPVLNEKGWDMPELKNFGRITTGNTPPRHEPANYDNNFIEWIKTDNIISEAVLVTNSVEYLSELGARKARAVTYGALLVACIAGSIESIGRAALTDRRVTFNQQINAIQPGEDVNPFYLYGLFKLSRSYIQSFATKGMKKIITKGDFEKIKMIKPPIEMQNQFAEIVKKIENIKSIYQYSLADLELLYGAVSQQAFKGELDLSRVPKLSKEQVLEKTMVADCLLTPSEQELVILLPDTDNLVAALQCVEARKSLLMEWLDAYCGQLGSTPFSVQHFMVAAQIRLAELQPDNDFSLSNIDYENIKAWVFDELSNGRLKQALNTTGLDESDKPILGNLIELKAVGQ